MYVNQSMNPKDHADGKLHWVEK